MDKKKESTYTPAMARAIKKHAEKLDRLYITVPVGMKAVMMEHAESQGESLNAFVTRSIKETIIRDKE